MSDLRDKIARALGAGLEDHERPVFAGRQLATAQAEAIADAVLAVIDLDKVRTEAFDRAWQEVRHIPHWWNTDDQYGEFDLLPLGPDETTERGAFMAVREALSNNPYRPTDKETEQ